MENEKSQINGLTAAEISKIKASLLAKRSEILGDVISMEDGVFRGKGDDVSGAQDHMTRDESDNYEIENTLELMDSEVRLVREIDEALERIEEGTYGICQGSGNIIPKTRLKAIPWAKYCIEYASMLEKNFVKRSSLPKRKYNFGDEDQDDDSRDTFRRAAV